MNKKTIEDIDVAGKRVLVRVDFNVPQDDSGAITDDRRIESALPTINYLLQQGAAVILMSHLGRPKGKITPEFSLTPVAKHLAGLLGADVALVQATESDPLGIEEAKTKIAPRSVVLLENTRYAGGEEINDPALSAQLATLADVYVNDAFGAAHRAHASTEGVAHAVKRAGKPAVSGYLMQKELDFLGGAITNPARPFVAILGGAKVKDKIPVIESLLPQVDTLIVGGGMAYTFYKAAGHEIGKSLLDETSLEFCKSLLCEDKIVLPQDCVVAPAFANDAPSTTVKVSEIPADQEGLDIGPASVAAFAEIIKKAKTVIWNGPMGVFEMPNFAHGTAGVAQALADATGLGATTIIGGGDSAAAAEQLGFADKITHISTGGGASLEFLEGKPLPGVVALDNK
ncbi:MAG: phosphoglycerate kinase [Fibrella sp.]|nr:phosphoglycerate kinase [Armatimonadota bacterium]